MPDHSHLSDDSPLHISQRMVAGVEAELIQTGDLTQIGHQTVNLHLPRAKPIGIPENIPFRGSTHFEGREEALERLRWELNQDDRVGVSAIAGMGGVGKTELAVQYARKHLNDYPGGVCWLQVRVGDPVVQMIGYVQNILGLEVPQEGSGQAVTLEQQLQWCWSHWEPAGRVLVVLDDVADLASCQPILLAPPERFRVVLTTRNQRLDTGFFQLNLDVLSPDAAFRLMDGLVGADRVRGKLAAANTLCHWLGYLPLGLELVGRYMAQDPWLSFAEMSEQLQAAEWTLADKSLEGDYPLMTAQQGVRAAFELSWQELDTDAQDVGRLLSLFAPSAVPWKLVTQVMQEVQGEIHRIRHGRLQLSNLSLLQPVEGLVEGVRLHPLIREFLQEKQEGTLKLHIAHDNLKRALAKIVVEISQDIPQTPTQETIQALAPIIPHLVEVAERFTDYLVQPGLNMLPV